LYNVSIRPTTLFSNNEEPFNLITPYMLSLFDQTQVYGEDCAGAVLAPLID
jgi:hypothetical protein